MQETHEVSEDETGENLASRGIVANYMITLYSSSHEQLR